MTLPVNSTSKKSTCTPISSQCVIWQGPDIACIDLCAGDSIDEVVYKLAVKICAFNDAGINITDVTWGCLVGEGDLDPTTISDALQLLISKIPCTPTPEAGVVLVNLPECLQYEEDFVPVTAVSYDTYLMLLATNVCAMLTEIAAIQVSITDINTRIDNVESDIAGLPSVDIMVQALCVGNIVTPSTIQTAYLALEADFCTLQDATGTPESIIAAIAKQCAGLKDELQLSGVEGVMSAITGWVVTPLTAADSLTNMWLTICDMRTAIVNLQTCCSNKCSDFLMDFTLFLDPARENATLVFFGLTSIPLGFTENVGTKVRISNGTLIVESAFLLDDYVANPGGLALDLVALGFLSTDNLTFTVYTGYTSATESCEKVADHYNNTPAIQYYYHFVQYCCTPSTLIPVRSLTPLTVGFGVILDSGIDRSYEVMGIYPGVVTSPNVVSTYIDCATAKTFTTPVEVC